MDVQAIRESIRMKLASGFLRQDDGMSVRSDMASPQPCRACGRMISPASAAPRGHAYPNGTHWFHVACHALWEDERRKPAASLQTVLGRYSW